MITMPFCALLLLNPDTKLNAMWWHVRLRSRTIKGFILTSLGANPDANLHLDLHQQALLLLTSTSPSRAALATLVPLLLDRLHKLIELPYLLVLSRGVSAFDIFLETYIPRR